MGDVLGAGDNNTLCDEQKSDEPLIQHAPQLSIEEARNIIRYFGFFGAIPDECSKM